MTSRQRKRKVVEIKKGHTTSYCVEKRTGRSSGNCRKTDYDDGDAMKFAFCEGTDILGLTECYSQFLSDVLHIVFQINPLRENGFFSSVSG